jgi:hypothetical protein
VLCLAWQDNNIVLSLSTVHTVHNVTDLITRERRRPRESSTNASIARKPFGNNVRMNLDIPTFIDDYNYHMGGVDLANQYRASYETHKTVFRSWFCIFTALLDIIIVNAYRISYIAAQQRGVSPNKLPKHVDFRRKLYIQLFSYSSDPTIQRGRQIERAPPLKSRVTGLHEWTIRAKRTGCLQCRIDIGATKKLRSQGLPVVYKPHTVGIVGRATVTNRGCKQCDVALCVRRGCWERFHGEK